MTPEAAGLEGIPEGGINIEENILNETEQVEETNNSELIMSEMIEPEHVINMSCDTEEMIHERENDTGKQKKIKRLLLKENITKKSK